MRELRVKPGDRVDLDRWDPADVSAVDEGERAGKGAQKLAELNGRLDALQEMLYAEHRHKVLVVLQGMDTSGKDGAIRHVFEGVNPQGVRVASFKVPSPEELDHDYLWRVHKQAPARGEIVIFNRSHYEDVLVVRVHGLVPEEIWRRRYDQINAFERLLAEEGTILLKFFLHIDLDEQKERLQARLDDPGKQWKFNPGDLDERKRWSEYQRAYEDALEKTSTQWAPWYIVPANKKWFRNLVIAKILVSALEDLKMKYPAPKGDLGQVVID